MIQDYWESEDKSVQLYCADCLEVMKNIIDVDAVITDPPYGVNWQSNWRNDKYELMKNDNAIFTNWISGIKANFFYCFSVWKTMQLYIDEISANNYEIKDVLVWDKKSHGMGDLNSYAPCYELIIFAKKDKSKLNFKHNRRQNVLRYWRVDGGATGISTNNILCHPAQKPVELIKALIMDCTELNNIVFDPFMGSGTTGVACVQTGRKFIGIEINKEYYNISKERISNAQLQIRMKI